MEACHNKSNIIYTMIILFILIDKQYKWNKTWLHIIGEGNIQTKWTDKIQNFFLLNPTKCMPTQPARGLTIFSSNKLILLKLKKGICRRLNNLIIKPRMHISVY